MSLKSLVWFLGKGMEEAQIFPDLLVVVGESTKVTDHDASGKKNPSLNMSQA